MKCWIRRIGILVCAFALVLGLTGCGGSGQKQIRIAVPNDTTNEARALLLLQDLGYITLKEGAGITATILDIADNPYHIDFVEAEAAQLPNLLPDVDYAIINSNYALSAGLDPMSEALAFESSSSPYGNVLAVRDGRQEEPLILALKAALESRQVADYIDSTYHGAVISVVDEPGDGYDDSIDYAALAGKTVTVAASPTPHGEILEVAKEILAARDITLEIVIYNDYVLPNEVVESGEIDANYFQHLPYLEDFNEQNGTHVVSLGPIHVEPFGIYGGRQSSLDYITE